ncbi:MAG TPA: glycine cleavage system aminomethyltransferase GcvT [Caulobacteraceae bacterium]|nr:glycine cleavage system aminomethyltransferase GcvT [Caulobacteraceae bacterium]
MSQPFKRTPLYEAHVAAGARLVEFGGYEMPVQYRDGVLKEHLWTRAHAGAFDVSHMGPAFLTLDRKSGDADADHRAVAAVIEPLISGDIASLKPGQIRYTLLLNEDGGIVDDLMIGRPVWPSRQGMLYIVVNAGAKEGDFARIQRGASGVATLARADDRALIAVQGPDAAGVVAGFFPEAAELTFMTHRRIDHAGEGCVVARCGYTGEDGYEILIRAPACVDFWDRLLADERVRPIGLGARDSLRLEAGLPLHGHDIDETTSAVEGDLSFAIAKPRLKAGRLRGSERMARELAGDLSRVRVGLRVLEGAPAREGAQIAAADGAVVGRVTSGGFSPSLGAPIAMGFVPPALAEPGTALKVIVRGKPQAAEVAGLPFVPHRYVRKV